MTSVFTIKKLGVKCYDAWHEKDIRKIVNQYKTGVNQFLSTEGQLEKEIGASIDMSRVQWSWSQLNALLLLSEKHLHF